MSSPYVNVVSPGESGEHVTFLEDADVHPENVSDMKFMFDKPNGITNSIKKRQEVPRSAYRVLGPNGCLAYTHAKI